MYDQGQNRIWGRYFAFLALSMLIVVINLYVASLFSPPPRQGVGDKAAAQIADRENRDNSATPPPEGGSPGQAQGQEPSEPSLSDQALASDAHPELPPAPLKYVTLGSFDPSSPYRMLVTLSSRGATVARLELNSPRYADTETPGGYLGAIFFEAPVDETDGLRVDVVGPGTPAALAGLRPGDVLVSLNGVSIRSVKDYRQALVKTRPGQKVPLEVHRDGQRLSLEAVLRRPPVVLAQREQNSPYSFETTLSVVDDQRLSDLRAALEESLSDIKDPLQKEVLYLRWLYAELDDVRLKSENWYLLPEEADPKIPETWLANQGPENLSEPRSDVRFAKIVPEKQIVLVKTYRLAQVPPNKLQDHDSPAYHLTLELSVFNIGQKPTTLAYELDGPNGLPTEGAWYARKMSNSWSAVGLRDVAVRIGQGSIKLVSCYSIARDNWGVPWKDTQGQPITALGVDAQYFAVILMPQREVQRDFWFEEARPIRIGPVERDYEYLTNVSCRLHSVPVELKPGESFTHVYKIFAGPKRQDLLTQYGLHDLIQYGWFWFVADPMTRLLHIFHDYMVFNYGLAIILLTVVVRLLMLPISRKQALTSLKMQELQPEIKKIQERYKDLQERNRAMQELFRQHNYNPFSGCLVVFLQLPIFIGLYKALAIDVELRQAPLISEHIRWCSNLAAPDMLFDWSFIWPEWFNRGHGMFALGPYFNILPIVTIAVFLWQQKRLMPPPADEQAALQQKVMNIMMIFMGILFYKVPSGLCLYFIASSFWGFGEREILLKAVKGHRQSQPKVKKDGQSTWRKLQDAMPDWLKDVIKSADKRYAEKQAREKRPLPKKTRV